VFGVIFLAVGGIVLPLRQGTIAQIRAVCATETYAAAAGEKLSAAIAEGLGQPGLFRQRVEVDDRIRCAEPLIAALSGGECVYAKTRVTRRVEKTEYERNEDGELERDADIETETIAEDERRARFELEDATGTVAIDLNGAQIEAIKAVECEQQTLAEFSPACSEFRWRSGCDNRDPDRVLGYRFLEWVLPVGERAYVLGEVSDRTGQLAIQQPLDPRDRFFVSHRSEEHFTQAKQATARCQRAGGAVAFTLSTARSF